jgi:hypothetical protein
MGAPAILFRVLLHPRATPPASRRLAAATTSRRMRNGGRREDRRHTALGCRDCLDHVRDGLAEGRQLGAIGAARWGSAKRLSQDTTQLRNGTGIQADAGWLVPEDHRSLTEKRPQLREGLEPSYLGAMPGGSPA